MTMSNRSMGSRVGVVAGYAAAGLMIAAVTPLLRRHPVRATAARAARGVATARSGIDVWLDLHVTPPPTFGELAFESVVAALLPRDPSPR